jgi:hypothetical protein
MFEYKINVMVIFSKKYVAFHVSGEFKSRSKMAYSYRVSDIDHGYKRLSFIAQMELGRLVGSTVRNERTACSGNILGACVLFCLVTVHIILFRCTCSWSLK